MLQLMDFIDETCRSSTVWCFSSFVECLYSNLIISNYHGFSGSCELEIKAHI